MDPRIKKAFDLIKRDFRSRLSLNALASKVKLSPFHLHRLFNREMHESPADCLARIRLGRAVHLMLLDPLIPISQLAADCGYTSLASFSRAFSKKFGMPPVKYTRAIRVHQEHSKSGDMKVEVVYYAGSAVCYEHTNMYNGELGKDFEKAASFCKKKGLSMTGQKIGVLTHITFHGAQTQLNYYAGIELKKGTTFEKYNDLVFPIPAGRYARFVTSVPPEHLRSEMLRFKHLWLDRSPYAIAEIFAFEEYLNSDVTPMPLRRVYIPIRGKRHE